MNEKPKVENPGWNRKKFIGKSDWKTTAPGLNEKKSGKNPGKEVQIVYRLFLVNFYLLHVPRLPPQPASSGTG